MYSWVISEPCAVDTQKTAASRGREPARGAAPAEKSEPSPVSGAKTGKDTSRRFLCTRCCGGDGWEEAAEAMLRQESCRHCDETTAVGQVLKDMLAKHRLGAEKLREEEEGKSREALLEDGSRSWRRAAMEIIINERCTCCTRQSVIGKVMTSMLRRSYLKDAEAAAAAAKTVTLPGGAAPPPPSPPRHHCPTFELRNKERTCCCDIAGPHRDEPSVCELEEIVASEIHQRYCGEDGPEPRSAHTPCGASGVKRWQDEDTCGRARCAEYAAPPPQEVAPPEPPEPPEPTCHETHSGRPFAGECRRKKDAARKLFHAKRAC